MSKPTLKPARQADNDPFARFNLQPQADKQQEIRRDWVRASYLGLLVLVFVRVIAFACYANQFVTGPKRRICLPWSFLPWLV